VVAFFCVHSTSLPPKAGGQDKFMGVQTILGQKIDQSQKFLEDGTRIPVTQLWVKGNVVVAVKTRDKHNYSAIQLGFGTWKKPNKAHLGQIKGASLLKAPKFLKEVRLNGEDSLPNLGEVINAAEVFKPGDIINVTGISKGKGYAGVVKRHHFKGGPRTHGQSDRERAPGSIGQTTTPGRVYKGKRMAGRMGHETATIRDLEIMDVSEDTILVKGLVPGGKNSLIMLKKVGENKKFVPLYRKKEDIESAERSAHAEGDAREDASRQSTSDDAQQVRSGSGQPQISDDAHQKEEKTVGDSGSLSEIQPTEMKEKPVEKSGANFSSSETGLTTSKNAEDIQNENEDKKEVEENAK